MYMHTHQHILYVESLGQKFYPAFELPGSHGSVRLNEKKKPTQQNKKQNQPNSKKKSEQSLNRKKVGKLKSNPVTISLA